MERNDVVSKLGFKVANGSRDAVVNAFRSQSPLVGASGPAYHLKYDARR